MLDYEEKGSNNRIQGHTGKAHANCQNLLLNETDNIISFCYSMSGSVLFKLARERMKKKRPNAKCGFYRWNEKILERSDRNAVA